MWSYMIMYNYVYIYASHMISDMIILNIYDHVWSYKNFYRVIFILVYDHITPDIIVHNDI